MQGRAWRTAHRLRNTCVTRQQSRAGCGWRAARRDRLQPLLQTSRMAGQAPRGAAARAAHRSPGAARARPRPRTRRRARPGRRRTRRAARRRRRGRPGAPRCAGGSAEQTAAGRPGGPRTRAPPPRAAGCARLHVWLGLAGLIVWPDGAQDHSCGTQRRAGWRPPLGCPRAPGCAGAGLHEGARRAGRCTPSGAGLPTALRCRCAVRKRGRQVRRGARAAGAALHR